MSGVICGSALLWQKAAYWSLPRLGNETQPVTQKTHLWNKPKAGWRWVNSLNIIFNLKVIASVQLYMSLTKKLWGGVLQIFFGDVLRIFFFAFIRWNHLSLFPMTWSVPVSYWKGESLKYIHHGDNILASHINHLKISELNTWCINLHLHFKNIWQDRTCPCILAKRKAIQNKCNPENRA